MECASVYVKEVANRLPFFVSKFAYNEKSAYNAKKQAMNLQDLLDFDFYAIEIKPRKPLTKAEIEYREKNGYDLNEIRRLKKLLQKNFELFVASQRIKRAKAERLQKSEIAEIRKKPKNKILEKGSFTIKTKQNERTNGKQSNQSSKTNQY